MRKLLIIGFLRLTTPDRDPGSKAMLKLNHPIDTRTIELAGITRRPGNRHDEPTPDFCYRVKCPETSTREVKKHGLARESVCRPDSPNA